MESGPASSGFPDREALRTDVLIVYWRPGCGFCASLRRTFRRAGLKTEEINIWQDRDAAGFVRSVAETRPSPPSSSDGAPMSTRRRGPCSTWSAAEPPTYWPNRGPTTIHDVSFAGSATNGDRPAVRAANGSTRPARRRERCSPLASSPARRRLRPGRVMAAP